MIGHIRTPATLTFQVLVNFFFIISDEEDLVDPLVTERERCVNSFECHAFRHAFEACQSRVKDEGIKENCTPEFFDLLECRDKCVSSLKKN